MELVNDTDCDSNSDDDEELIDEQRVEFFNNLIDDHEKLIKSYMKNNDILEAHKTRLMCLILKRLICLRKLDFLNLSIILSLRRIMPLLKR